VPPISDKTNSKLENRNKHLNILDGVELSEQQYKFINPNDCESMMELNPSLAMARYGEKGKYGVMIITSLTSGEKLIVNDPDAEESTFFKSENMPEYPGGEFALTKWISQSINYPEEVRRAGIKGTVLVNFIVTKSGKVVQAKVVRGIDPRLDAESERVVSQMPDWKP